MLCHHGMLSVGRAKCVRDMVETAARGMGDGAVRICVLLDNVYGIFRVAEMVSIDRTPPHAN